VIVTVQNATAAVTNVTWTPAADTTLVAVAGNASFAVSGDPSATWTDVSAPTSGVNRSFLVVFATGSGFLLPSGGVGLIGGEAITVHFSGKGTAQLYLT